jgi:hypothetical protein
MLKLVCTYFNKRESKIFEPSGSEHSSNLSVPYLVMNVILIFLLYLLWSITQVTEMIR